MATFFLVLTWAALGVMSGLLVQAAYLKPAHWGKTGWLWLLVLGLGTALAGGLLGFWIFGRLFSALCALWIAVLATSLPGIYMRVRVRLARRNAAQVSSRKVF